MKIFHVDRDVIHYGLRDGKLEHIDNVANGQSCGCICPACKEPLIAYNRPGIKVTPHFQHKSKLDCWNSYETTLHYLSKEIIEESKFLIVPDIRFELYNEASLYIREIDSPQLVIKEKKLYLDRVLVEKSEGAIRPDIVGYIGDKVFYIEVAVTHFIDEVKKKKIIENKIPTLEIDLSNFSRMIKKEDLQKILLNGTDNKRWIFNLRNVERFKKAERQAEPIKDFVNKNKRNLKVYGIKQTVYNCPVYSSNVRLDEDCSSCQYLVQEWEGDKYVDHEKVKYPHLTIDCIGHLSETYDNLLEKCGIKS